MSEEPIAVPAIPESVLEGVYPAGRMELSFGTRDDLPWMRLRPLYMPAGVSVSVRLSDGQMLHFES